MFRSAICVCLLGALVTVAWSDEIVRARPGVGKKQRVDPKLLQEASAVPESTLKAPDSQALLLEDLQKLADKLKQNGDIEGYDLIQKFITEHQRLVNQTLQSAVSSHDRRYLVLKIVEVNLDDLPADSIIRNDLTKNIRKTQGEAANIYVQELERLVENKLAKSLVDPSLKVRSDGHSFHTASDEFPIPIAGLAVKMNFREVGVSIEAEPTNIGEQKIRLQSTCKFSLKDQGASAAEAKEGSDFEVQSAFELSFGEPAIQSSMASPNSRTQWFVIYKFVPRS